MKMNKYIHCQLLSMVCERESVLQQQLPNSSITWQNPLKLGETTICWLCFVKIRWKICMNRSMPSYFCEIPQDPSLWLDFSERTLHASALQYFRVAFPSPKGCRALERSSSFSLKHCQQRNAIGSPSKRDEFLFKPSYAIPQQ